MPDEVVYGGPRNALMSALRGRGKIASADPAWKASQCLSTETHRWRVLCHDPAHAHFLAAGSSCGEVWIFDFSVNRKPASIARASFPSASLC